MARRLADDGDVGTPRRSVADLLREAGIDENSAPRRRRRFIEPDDEPGVDEEFAAGDGPGADEAPDAGEEAPDAGDDPGVGEEPGTNDDPSRPAAEESTDDRLDADDSNAPRDGIESDEPADAPDADGPVTPADDNESQSSIDGIGDHAPDAGASARDEPSDVPDEPSDVPDEPSDVPEEPSAPDESAAAGVPAKSAREHSGPTRWALAIGEVVLAIAIGIGLSFVFRLLWDIVPYAAAVLAPVVICAVVAIVGFGRKKMGLGSIPLSLLLLVLFVTALLVVIPAALALSAP